jgi:hypothetical protein
MGLVVAPVSQVGQMSFAKYAVILLAVTVYRSLLWNTQTLLTVPADTDIRTSRALVSLDTESLQGKRGMYGNGDVAIQS